MGDAEKPRLCLLVGIFQQFPGLLLMLIVGLGLSIASAAARSLAFSFPCGQGTVAGFWSPLTEGMN